MTSNEFDKRMKQMFFPQQAVFDFMGFLHKEERNISKASISLGLNYETITRAQELGSDVLLVHNAPENLGTLEYYMAMKQTLKEFSLSIYRVHLPMDFSTGGLIAALCSMLQFPMARPTTLRYAGHRIVGGVYVAKEECSRETLLRRVERLCPRSIRVAGVVRERFQKIAITTGDGCKPEFLDQIKPDAFVCGLLNQEAARIARDMGIMIIEATSYSTENEPLKIIFRTLKQHLSPVQCEFIDIGDTIESVPNDKTKESNVQ